MNLNLKENDKKQIIVVLGMHRSGTSVITRGLNALGVSLGNNLMPPHPIVNAKGFFEDLEINYLNIEVLSEIGMDWSSISPISDQQVEILRKQGFILRAVELLREKVKNKDAYAFKDPRVAKLLPFWNEVFPKLNIDIFYVLTLRHPLSVVKSLAKREGFSLTHSYLLWAGYVLESLRGSTGKPRVIVNYDQLINSPELQLKRIAETCPINLNFQGLDEYKNEFLDHSLRHTQYEANDLLLDTSCPPLVKDIFNSLTKVADDEIKLDDSSFLVDLNKWLIEFNRLTTIMNFTDHQLTQIKYLNQEMQNQNKEIEKLNQEIQHRNKQIEKLNQELDAQDNSLILTVKEREDKIRAWFRSDKL